jgi:hypothetical protein
MKKETEEMFLDFVKLFSLMDYLVKKYGDKKVLAESSGYFGGLVSGGAMNKEKFLEICSNAFDFAKTTNAIFDIVKGNFSNKEGEK